MVSTANVDTRKLFPRKKQKTTVEKHKAEANKVKSERAEQTIRRKKLIMMNKCADVLAQFGLHFEPVVIGQFPLVEQKETETGDAAVASPTKTTKPAKSAKTRPLLQKKVKTGSSVSEATSGRKKKPSGLKVKTITPSIMTGKRKGRSHS